MSNFRRIVVQDVWVVRMERGIVLVVAMRSIFSPTDIPRPNRIKAGLVASQQQTLKSLAEGFKTYLASHPDAHLMLTGYADQRGPHPYNKALSERRAEVAKSFLGG